ncbi:MAG: hypothetical protein ACE5KZ_04705 [Candidatus Scalinduaceae bacterium]
MVFIVLLATSLSFQECSKEKPPYPPSPVISGVLYMWVMPENVRGGHCQLYYSRNYAQEWNEAEWKFMEDDRAFTVNTFLNFGKDYKGARDGYVCFVLC